MRRISRWLGVALAVLGIFWGGFRIAEHRVHARLDDLAAQLRAPDHPSKAAWYWMVRARVTAIDAYLDQRARARDGFAVPAMWGPEHRAELEQSLASLGSFFEQVDSLLADQMCRLALQRGDVTSESPPLLALSRHRTNVLCARALLDLDGPDGSRAAAKHLGQALDLIRLGDDGLSMSYSISVAEESIVLSALQRLLEDTRSDGAEFRDELEARLERASKDERVASVLFNDVADYRNYENGRSRPLWKRVEDLMARHRVADGLETSLRLVHASGAESRSAFELERANDLGWARTWMVIADGSHLVLEEKDLARRALAIAADARATGAPPTDRFSGAPVHEDRTERGVELRADGALAALDLAPSDPRAHLLCWTIPR